MRATLSPTQMQTMENMYAAASGTATLDLMERAAQHVVAAIEEMLGGYEGKRAYFACGPGGNGGDGYAAARLFASRGGRSVIVSVNDEEKLRGDARTNCRRAHEAARCFFQDVSSIGALPPPDIWVDALFGIGLSKQLQGDALLIARRMNADGRVLSIDIPSGISGTTGRALGEYVRAELTVTFESEKWGHHLNDGLDYCGKIISQSIGIPNELFPKDAVYLVEGSDLAPVRLPRRRNSQKGDYGRLLIIAGSFGMAGACAIAARAALRSGVGLVSVACPASIVNVVQQLAPCATCIPLPESGGAISSDAVPLLRDALGTSSAVAIGPGLSRRCAAAVVATVVSCGRPVVLDADALNLVSDSVRLRKLICSHHVITPHMGEAARLLNRACEDPISDARALQKMGCVVLLKGASSVIVGKHTRISQSGTPGMSKGGSGDALTGIVGALLARGYDAEDAAWMGSHIHGLAGEAAARLHGESSMTALDLIDALGGILS